MKKQSRIGRYQFIQTDQFSVLREFLSRQDLIPENRHRIQIGPRAQLFPSVKHHFRRHISGLSKIILISKLFFAVHGICAVEIQQKKPGGKSLMILRAQQKDIVRTDVQVQQVMIVKRLQRMKKIFDKENRIRQGRKIYPLLLHFRQNLSLFGSQNRVNRIICLKGIQILSDMLALRLRQNQMRVVSSDKAFFMIVKEIHILSTYHQIPMFIPCDFSLRVKRIQFFQEYNMFPVRHKSVVIIRPVDNRIGTRPHILINGICPALCRNRIALGKKTSLTHRYLPYLK